MKLLQVYSAKHHSSGNIDMLIRAEINGEEMDIEFGYRAGDPHGLGPALDAWWEANQKFPVAPADPILEPAPTTDAQKLDRLFQSVGLTTDAVRTILGVR